jgi:hypothetical protein
LFDSVLVWGKNEQKLSAIVEGTSKFVLGSSFKTDGHSVSVLVYDLKKEKKQKKKSSGEPLDLLAQAKTFKIPTKFFSDELSKEYKPDWIVGVDFGVRYAAGLFAKKFSGTEEENQRDKRTLTIKTKALFDPTWRF